MRAHEDEDQVATAGRVLDHGNRDGPDGGTVALGEQDAVLLHGGQTFTSGDKRDVVPGLVQAGGVQAAENTGPVDKNFYEDPPESTKRNALFRIA